MCCCRQIRSYRAYGQLLRSLRSMCSRRHMTIGARVTYFADALQQRLSTALVWLGDAIAFLSRTAWPLVDLLIRIWIGKLALVLSVLISTDWAMAVSMAAGSYPIPVAGLGSTALLSQVYWLAAVSLIP